MALGSGWANTSAITADAEYAAYVIVLRADDPTPFFPQSDEEPEPEDDASGDEEADAGSRDARGQSAEASGEDAAPEEEMEVLIDIERIDRRTVALPLPEASYAVHARRPEGTVFIGEYAPGAPGLTLHKFDLKEREATEFATSVRQVAVSADAQKMVVNAGGWKVVGTGGSEAGGGESFSPTLQTELDRQAEWKQMFDEAWRYQRDYFYDDNMHGRDWDEVYARYAPLVPHIRHRADLNYVLDQMNGELSVGHSFVFGGDMPETDRPRVGLLGADLEARPTTAGASRASTRPKAGTPAWTRRWTAPA